MQYDTKNTIAQMDAMVEVNGQPMTQEQAIESRRGELQELKSAFSKQRDDWVKYRAQQGVERRWRLSQAMYSGSDSEKMDSGLADTLKNGPSVRQRNAASATRSRVVVNIVRPKVDQAVARMCEILLPVDDRNWGIKPTPVPQAVSEMLGNHAELVDDYGQPAGVTGDQQAQAIVKRTKKAAEAMEREIEDCLLQCQYNGEQRKVIENGVKLGTGCLLGPFPSNSTRRAWVPNPDGTMKLDISTELSPMTMSGDPWDIFTDPACGNDHQRGAGFYHRRFVTKKEIRALKGMPGYDDEAIRDVLRSKPTRTKVAEGRIIRDLCDEESYEMWVYYGDVEPDQMELLSESMCAEDEDPLLNVECGIIILIGDTVIGAMESWIPDGSLPLDMWCWRKSDDSPFGHSLPEEQAHQQRVITSAWRQVMDDAKFSVGGQLVIKKKMVIPQDGSYEMYPGKTWLASDELEDVTKAMHMFEFKNHAPELLQITAAAMQFNDQETSMPQIMGGDKGGAPETVGGMVMLYNNANVVLRLRVKLYDDNITGPHLRRHYDWQMAYSQKQDIKGDMEVDARGSTALLEKDIQNQATLNLANVTSNPRYQQFIDPKEELKVVLRAFKINPDDIMFSEDRIRQNAESQAQQPPQDPRIVSAQMILQGKQLDIKDRQEQRQVDAQLQSAELKVKRESIAYNTERERSDGQQKMVEAKFARELAIAKMQQDGVMSQEEIASKGRLQAIQLDQKAQLFNAEAALRVNTGEGI